jgi:1-aminocyclopropane-1-carboxylate deaminase
MQYKNVSQVFSLLQTSQLQNLSLKVAADQGVLVDVKRDDLLHPIISGNKWRKLKYLLLSIEAKGFRKVATMGGAYSNFIHALSYVCHLLGWQCDLYIRAHSGQPLTSTLTDCIQWGANIHYVDRKGFRALREKSPELAEDVFWISEGGMHEKSILGLKEIMMELNHQYDFLVIATATGTSVAGLIDGAAIYQPDAKVIGISVLNNAEQQRKDVAQLSPQAKNDWSILEGYEFGGFAKSNLELKLFTAEFYQQYKIPLESVYSGKSFYAVTDLISKGFFAKNSRILLIHCGGLQGAR